MSSPRLVPARLLLVFSGMTATSAFAASAPKADTPEAIFARDIKPFIVENCIDCHDDGSAKGGLRLDALDLQKVESMRTHRDTWERVLTKVSHAVMPPPKAAQPEASERSKMVTALDKVLHPIDPAKPDAGRVTLRRLNREEYKNTVQDVLGVTFDPAADFPADDSGYGYDNIGDVLTLSPLLFERYLSAAKAIARDVVPERTVATRMIFGSPDLFKGENVVLLTPTLKYERATRTSWTFTAPATGMYKLSSSAGSGTGEGATGVIFYNVEVDGDAVGKALNTGTGTRDTGFEQSMPDVKLTRGTHTITVDWFQPQPPQPTPPAAAQGAGPAGAGPAVAGNAPASAAAPAPAPAANVAANTPAPAAPAAPAPTPAADPANPAAPAAPNPAALVSQAVQPPAAPGAPGAGRAGGAGRGGRGGRGGGGPNVGSLWLHWVRVEGPFNAEPVTPNSNFARLVGPQKQGESQNAYITRGVTALATPLLRRVPSRDEINNLSAVVKSSLAAGGSMEAAWQTGIQAILVTPSFLFRGEVPGRNEKADRNYAIGEPELASRLSYFLWSTAPDDRLRDLAAQGKLRTNLNAEIKRMLADPKAERFVKNFAGQWLHLRNLPQRETDPKLYPSWGPAIAADMAMETQKFFADFLTNGQPIGKMLTADYSFISPLLAKFYGIDKDMPGAAALSLPPVAAASAPAPYGAAPAAAPAADPAAAPAATPAAPAVAAANPAAPAAGPAVAGAAGRGRGAGAGAGAPGAGRGPATPPPPAKPSTPEEFVRMTVPAERQAGVLGQASILALSSYANRTSPVLRGKFVLDSILGTAPPPAPADVPGLPETVTGTQPATVRERLAFHREKPECAICHKDIDPLGFALENFDATGAFRTTENGLPVDSVGEMPNGEKVSGAVALGRLLANTRINDFNKNFASQLLTFAIGRGVDYYDRPTIEQILASAAKNGHTMPAYIEAVANSLAFQQRRGEPELGPAPAAPTAKKVVSR